MGSAMHQPSNFATYRDDSGSPVFETYFVRAKWGKGFALYAYESWHAREDALEIAAISGVECEALSHRDAFLMIRAGETAWIHELTVSGIQAFRPLYIQFPAIVA
jgi:hypothetical protein